MSCERVRTHGQVRGSLLFEYEAIFPQLLLSLTVARHHVLPLSETKEQQGENCTNRCEIQRTWITFSETKIDAGVKSRTGINLEVYW